MTIHLGRLGTFAPDRWRAHVDVKHALSYSWAAVGSAAVVAFIMLVTGSMPVPSLATMMAPLPEEPVLPQSTRILDVNGRLIETLHGEEHRMLVSRKHIPEHVRLAVLAIEDHDFYNHGAVEPAAVARALLANVMARRIEQGGSTITQQYVRNAYREVGRERTMQRKIKETLMSIQYERDHPKDEILDKYLNTVYFGRGAYGIEAAARTYFGKRARHLKLQQSAFLAGVIHAPQAYVSNPKAAKARRNVVLARMARLGFISEKRAAAMRKSPLRFHRDTVERERAAYFVEFVRRQLKRPVENGGFGLTDRDILTGGLTVHTTLDLRLQDAAERAVAAVLDRKDDPEAALVAMTSTGEVRAMVGGRDSTSVARARGFNFATQMVRGGGRQAGSSFKPFTLAAYIRQGYSVHRRFSAPSRIGVPKCANPGRVWTPANYQNQGFGSLDVLEATEKSVNTVYAQMVALVGPEHAVDAARDAGVVSDLAPVCSIALGTFGVTPLEMARAYATFSARGARPEILTVRKVVDRRGKVIAERAIKSEQTMERDVVDQVNEILKGVMTRGTGTPAAISRPSAGKTGTTDEHRDVWFAGYTPHPGLAAAVWIGHPPDKNGKIREMTNLHGRLATGGYFAGGIWRRFMTEAMKGEPERSFPDAEFTGRRGGSIGVVIRQRREDPRPSSTTVQVPKREERKQEQKQDDGKGQEDDKPKGNAAASPPPSTEPEPQPEPSPTPT